MESRQCHQTRPLRIEKWTGPHKHRPGAAFLESLKSALKLVIAVDLHDSQLLPDRFGRLLYSFQFRRCVGQRRIRQNCNCGRLRCELSQKLQTLRSQKRAEKDNTRNIATRSVEI